MDWVLSNLGLQDVEERENQVPHLPDRRRKWDLSELLPQCMPHEPDSPESPVAVNWSRPKSKLSPYEYHVHSANGRDRDDMEEKGHAGLSAHSSA
eukprot:816944-Rhodomonas_salina.1